MLKCIFNQNDMCQRLNLKTFDDCRCPLYRSSMPDNCAICGNPILGPTIWFEGNGLCENCGHQIGTCQTCWERSYCVFETDPSPVPKMVQQTVRNGNMVSSFPVKNPARIAITCQSQKCPCYAPENRCLRDLGSCDGWKLTAETSEDAARSVEQTVPAE